MPTEQELAAMTHFNDELVESGAMLAGGGTSCQRRRRGERTPPPSSARSAIVPSKRSFRVSPAKLGKGRE